MDESGNIYEHKRRHIEHIRCIVGADRRGPTQAWAGVLSCSESWPPLSHPASRRSPPPRRPHQKPVVRRLLSQPPHQPPLPPRGWARNVVMGVARFMRLGKSLCTALGGVVLQVRESYECLGVEGRGVGDCLANAQYHHWVPPSRKRAEQAAKAHRESLLRRRAFEA